VNRSRQGGFTLIEVMIATAVLGFVLLAFMSIMTSAATLSSSTRESVLAAYDLQAALEDTLSIPFSNFQINYSLSTAPVLGVSAPSSGSPEPASDTTHKPLVSTPFDKYWDIQDGNPAHQRPLQNEAVWIDIVNGTGLSNPVSYRINIRWKSHKGYYQRDFVDMVRSSR
jgi:prepilin-type N-terminal cleavage/methylation domain-containing protein